MHSSYLPSASVETLRQRARMLACIREYFAGEGVLEVETPLLCSSTAMDPHLQSFSVEAMGAPQFLQTSPEFPMKRLLAAGSGSIYQVCKAFRADECGGRHNPEFSLLEWYRVGWSAERLQQEVLSLVQRVAGLFGVEWPVHATLSYRELFRRRLGLDPMTASEDELAAVAVRHLGSDLPVLDRPGWLDLLMSQVIEPRLPVGLQMVVGFPAEQAALARRVRDADGFEVCERFELYVNGMELANGYGELTDADEQRLRFEADNRVRAASGLPVLPVPEPLLQALESGLPDCAGVALGLDRLLMAALGKTSISEVLSFDFTRA
ncbi:MAG: EF-P lysine aminoacylase EpmA [Ketobacteraceae bacterium]|nr:EF-P lysine aminoacylase EpmA [Ketobacteraceae bacterium]